MTVPRGVLAIVGATATGKSALAVETALRLGGEVISADAFTAYRGIDAGTAKPTLEERRGVPHHVHVRGHDAAERRGGAGEEDDGGFSHVDFHLYSWTRPAHFIFDRWVTARNNFPSTNVRRRRHER